MKVDSPRKLGSTSAGAVNSRLPFKVMGRNQCLLIRSGNRMFDVSLLQILSGVSHLNTAPLRLGELFAKPTIEIDQAVACIRMEALSYNGGRSMSRLESVISTKSTTIFYSQGGSSYEKKIAEYFATTFLRLRRVTSCFDASFEVLGG